MGERPVEPDSRVAHPARVYNAWLGGRDHYPVDEEAAELAAAANPGIVPAVRANRAFLGRTVRHLAGEVGIRQFLDIGTGIPSAGNTHEVAQSVAADARIVYVDNDRIVLAHARARLFGTSEGRTAYIEADARDVEAILAEASHTLDFTRPVALMLLAVLQYIPDPDDPAALTARLLAGLPAGSHVVISHPAADIAAAAVARSMRVYNDRAAASAAAAARTREEVARLFADTELLEPGLVSLPHWRPEPQDEAPAAVPMWGGVGRVR